jgi:hypothetical protein
MLLAAALEFLGDGEAGDNFGGEHSRTGLDGADRRCTLTACCTGGR